MSATYFLKFGANYVRLTFAAGKPMAQMVDRNRATPFTSEPEAWLAATQYQLKPESWCSVLPAAEALKEAAC